MAYLQECGGSFGCCLLVYLHPFFIETFTQIYIFSEHRTQRIVYLVILSIKHMRNISKFHITVNSKMNAKFPIIVTEFFLHISCFVDLCESHGPVNLGHESESS